MVSLTVRMARGAAAGAVATAAMSVVMLGARRLHGGEPEPELVTEGTLGKAGVSLDERTANVASSVSHLAYGCAAGALFAAARPHLSLPAPVLGPAYGLVLSLGSYEGWLPAVNILPPLHDLRAERAVPLLAAHLVYGAVLAALTTES